MDAVFALDREPGGNGWSREQFLSACQGHNNERALLLFVQGEPIGFLVYQTVLDEAEVLNVVVAKSARGRGNGRRLLNDLCVRLRKQGVKRLFLEVRIGNVAAISLYRAVGFTRIGLRKNYYRSGSGREDALMLALELI
ncbi:MAG: ribosomal-protein-alanine N-acetyltransferase [Gammaproteobacteria bacterium]|nr:MAG: ribosomal-protein-alanine N-acetyltransferase [Gammaproteobacteria bacterium]